MSFTNLLHSSSPFFESKLKIFLNYCIIKNIKIEQATLTFLSNDWKNLLSRVAIDKRRQQYEGRWDLISFKKWEILEKGLCWPNIFRDTNVHDFLASYVEGCTNLDCKPRFTFACIHKRSFKWSSFHCTLENYWL